MNGGLAQLARVTAAAAPELTREAQMIALRLAAPKRADAGQIIVQQHDASDCPLFRLADEPRLI